MPKHRRVLTPEDLSVETDDDEDDDGEDSASVRRL